MKRLLILTLLLCGCTDGEVAAFGALGNPAHVKCYSGNLLIYEGDSTGAVSSEAHSDGWYFNDAKTSTLVRVSGACVITPVPERK